MTARRANGTVEAVVHLKKARCCIQAILAIEVQYSAFNFILPPLIVVESNRGACRVYGVMHGLCFMCAITIQVRPELTSAMTLNSEISPRLGCGINSSQRDNCSVRFTVAVVRLSYALTQRVVNANERTLFGSQRRPAGQPNCARVCG